MAGSGSSFHGYNRAFFNTGLSSPTATLVGFGQVTVVAVDAEQAVDGADFMKAALMAGCASSGSAYTVTETMYPEAAVAATVRL